MAYKMKGFGGFKSSPAKQKTREDVEKKIKAEQDFMGKKNWTENELIKMDPEKRKDLIEKMKKGVLEINKETYEKISNVLKKKMGPKSPAKQEGPLPKENPNLKKSEMEGTWVYKGKNLNERAIDLDERAGFIEEDISNTGKTTKQQKKDIKFLDRERDIISKRIKNTTKPYQRNVKPQYDDKGKRIKPPMAPKKKK